MKTASKISLLGLSLLLVCSAYAQQKQKKRSNNKGRKSTVNFTPPVIENDTVNNESSYQISIADVKGSDEEEGIDIVELQECRVVIEDRRDRAFVTVEQMPRFPGGDQKMMAFVADSLQYPVVAAESGIQGRVIVRFVVDKEGNVTQPTVIRGIDPSCDKEAIRIIKLMPKWEPGKQNGQNVPVYFTLPILFRLK